MKISASGTITEGDGNSADFTITSEVLITSKTIFYTPVGANFMESGSGVKTFATLNFIGEGPYTATLPIRVEDDDVKESDETISVTLNDETTPTKTYLVAPSPHHSASVNVRDNDAPPLITIASHSGEVAENVNGGKAAFKLTATGLSVNRQLMINATPAEDGSDFLATNVQGTAKDFPVNFTDPDNDGTYSGDLLVDLDNDQVGETTGNIKLTLNTDSASPVTYRLGSTTEGTLTVLDDDAPEMKITAGDPVVEADNVSANFTISARVSPNDYVTIRYNSEESQNFVNFEGSGKTERLDFRNNATEVTLPIDIVNDDTYEDNGTITVTLTADTADTIKYTVAPSPNNSATVNVYDDDSLPTISIKANSGEVAESDRMARFELSATNFTQTTTVMVKGTPAEDGSDFLTDDIADDEDDFAVEFTDPDDDNTYTGELLVMLDDDLVGETTGRIRLTLSANPTRYKLGSTTRGVITILDDDAPELRISTDAAITENDNVNAIFVITAKVSPNEPIDVQYDVAESQNFINVEGPGKTARLDFSNGVKTATIPIQIINDNTIENDGTVIATLNADSIGTIDYLVASSPNHMATVTVYDDDSPPTISIDERNGEVFERVGTNAGIATFNLTATGFTQTTTLSVNATAAEVDGDYLPATNPTSYSVEFSDPDGDNTYRGVLSVPLDNDSTGEATAEVMVTLMPILSYTD